MRPTPHPDAERPRARTRSPAPPVVDEVADSLADMEILIQGCRRCDLWRHATQGVAGEGPRRAKIMLVGEQPGDREDLAGKPFVGPAGQLLDQTLAAAGVERSDYYVTNAVKHFKFEPRGKRRLHKSPNVGEIKACRWWLEQEVKLVRPQVIIALGASAARAVLNRPVGLMKERGRPIDLGDGGIAFLTIHPSAALRAPDAEARAGARALLQGDLAAAAALVG